MPSLLASFTAVWCVCAITRRRGYFCGAPLFISLSQGTWKLIKGYRSNGAFAALLGERGDLDGSDDEGAVEASPLKKGKKRKSRGKRASAGAEARAGASPTRKRCILL